MNIKQLKEIINNLPDNTPVEINIVSEGEYYDEGVDAFVYYNDNGFDKALVITVGDSEDE